MRLGRTGIEPCPSSFRAKSGDYLAGFWPRFSDQFSTTTTPRSDDDDDVSSSSVETMGEGRCRRFSKTC